MTTTNPHDAHGANEGCSACGMEHRDLWPVRYAEVDPVGPHVSGDVGGDNQVSEAWGRRFYRVLPDGEYAVIDVDFYVEDENGQDHEDRPRLVITRQTHFARCTDLEDPGSSETYADVMYATETTFAPPTEELAKRMCAEFDPAELDWNGHRDGHRECRVVVSPYRPGLVQTFCTAHHTRFSVVRPERREGVASFVCDKGEGWIFQVDTGTDDDPHPALVSLAGLNEAVTRAVVQRRFCGPDEGGALRAWHYAGPGNLVELDIAPHPHRKPSRSVPYEGGPLLISTDYEVTGPREDGGPGRVRYLETTITVPGDA